VPVARALTRVLYIDHDGDLWAGRGSTFPRWMVPQWAVELIVPDEWAARYAAGTLDS